MQLKEQPCIEPDLMPYRRETGCGKGVFDATGLGKTIQTLAFCAAMKTMSTLKDHPLSQHPMALRLACGYPVLIVCPSSVVMA